MFTGSDIGKHFFKALVAWALIILVIGIVIGLLISWLAV